MGQSSSLPAWAPSGLPKKKRPAAYLELRHPNGSVVHVVGTKRLSKEGVSEARRVVGLAQPDSVLVELCEERIASTWELIQQGTATDEGIRRPLPALSFDAFKNDARLRSVKFWLWGLEVEGLAALLGTTANATQAAAAAEASKMGAQTHHLDRRESATAQRCFVAYLENKPWQESKLWSLVDEVLKPARDAARSSREEKNQAGKNFRDTARVALDNFEAQIFSHEKDAKEKDPVFDALANVLLDERDEIFAHRCWECLSHLGPGGIAVAVVHQNHLPGIKRHWANTNIDRVKTLLQPRDAPAVLCAVAPYAGATALSFAAIAYLPKRPRQIALNALLIAPILATGYAANRSLKHYSDIRHNLQNN